jgi:hypothetical protein
MASGRMIRSQISISPQVNDLSLKGALLFTWIIPHVDDFGRIHADPRRIKAKVVPMRDDISSKEIASLLNEMEDKNLIVLYSVENEIYLQLTKFEKHQSGLHKRTESKLPPPEAASNKDSGKFREIPGNSFPTRTGTEQEQELEQKKETSTSSPDFSISEIFEHWKKTMGHEKAVLEKKRISKISSALKLGYTVENLKNAISGCALSSWHMENKQDKLISILRDADCIDTHIERFVGGGAKHKNHVLKGLGYFDALGDT